MECSRAETALGDFDGIKEKAIEKMDQHTLEDPDLLRRMQSILGWNEDNLDLVWIRRRGRGLRSRREGHRSVTSG